MMDLRRVCQVEGAVSSELTSYDTASSNQKTLFNVIDIIRKVDI